MRKAVLWKTLAAGVAIAISFASQSLRAQENVLSGLQQGGYVIYFRHAQASNEARPDAKLPDPVKDCKGQRHVTAAGVTAMQTLGTNLRAMKIPVGKVISSPACTAKETAWYALRASAEVADTLDGNPREQIWTELHPFLKVVPTKGTNTLLFAHSTNIKALTGLAIAEGEAVVFQPDGQGGFTYVARLKPEEWAAKAR